MLNVLPSLNKVLLLLLLLLLQMLTIGIQICYDKTQVKFFYGSKSLAKKFCLTSSKFKFCFWQGHLRCSDTSSKVII